MSNVRDTRRGKKSEGALRTALSKGTSKTVRYIKNNKWIAIVLLASIIIAITILARQLF